MSIPRDTFRAHLSSTFIQSQLLRLLLLLLIFSLDKMMCKSKCMYVCFLYGYSKPGNYCTDVTKKVKTTLVFFLWLMLLCSKVVMPLFLFFTLLPPTLHLLTHAMQEDTCMKRQKGEREREIHVCLHKYTTFVWV